MPSLIIAIALAAAVVAWTALEALYGYAVLWGRCDKESFVSSRAPIAVTGFLESGNQPCLFCTLETAKAGYRFIEFAVSEENDRDEVRRFLGIHQPGYYRVVFHSRQEVSGEPSKPCDDHLPAFQRFKSSAWCPRLSAIQHPTAEYCRCETSSRRAMFLGVLNNIEFSIKNRQSGEVLGYYQNYSWSPTGPIASQILNRTSWPLGFGGATCPDKNVPDTTKVITPLKR